jgi:hypothetical protein
LSLKIHDCRMTSIGIFDLRPDLFDKATSVPNDI